MLYFDAFTIEGGSRCSDGVKIITYSAVLDNGDMLPEFISVSK